jgi:hypothetical protein
MERVGYFAGVMDEEIVWMVEGGEHGASRGDFKFF